MKVHYHKHTTTNTITNTLTVDWLLNWMSIESETGSDDALALYVAALDECIRISLQNTELESIVLT